MSYRQLGKTDLKVKRVGFGGAEIGFENKSVDEVRDLLNSALDDGLNVIDTAECYLSSEALIGEAISHRREEYYLFTKCGHKSGLDYPDWSSELINQSVYRSLNNLRTDYIDILHLHGCPRDVMEQTNIIDSLIKIKESGACRYIGYSGDGEDALYAIQSGVFDTLQTTINIADQESVSFLLPAVEERNIGLIAKRPIANVAWIKGENEHKKYLQMLDMSSKLGKKLNIPPKAVVTYYDRLNKLNYDFSHLMKHEVELSNIALRFTLSIPAVDIAIIGTTNPSRWKENEAYLLEGHYQKRFIIILETGGRRLQIQHGEQSIN